MNFCAIRRSLAVASVVIAASLAAPAQADLRVTAFMQGVATAAAQDADLSAFYKANGYQSVWTGRSIRERQRRAALLEALRMAPVHGLPAARYNVDALEARIKAARSQQDRAALEVELSRVFVDFAADLQTGVIRNPRKIDRAIVRAIPHRDRVSYLTNFAKSSPRAFFRALPPKTAEYTALMKEKRRLEETLGAGGWGPAVPQTQLAPGATGPAVVALRDRLMRMGYLGRSNSGSYDAQMVEAVKRFQQAHGLVVDGVAGPGTLQEVNISLEDRMKSVLVALERERWLNKDRGQRHVLVNIPDFSAQIIDNGKVTFQTRTVVGARQDDRPTPEFSDVMEFMVINPSWYVPRSIIVKEFLPALKSNRNAVGHIEITDRNGRRIDRSAVNFANYSASNFPFAMRQPPSRRNALGLVKFMFPNQYNIYLHDTPHKNLFGREVRAYSHGCVRLAEPFDFAYTLLAKQEADPKRFFHSVLDTGAERRVDLKEPVPVHLVYRTAFTSARGELNFRRDVYGRDARIWNALAGAGVALLAYRS